MSGAKPLLLSILQLRAKGFYHLEIFSLRSVNLTVLYQLLQLKVAKSVIFLSLLAPTLSVLYLILIFSAIRYGDELNKQNELYLLYYLPRFVVKTEFEAYGHTEKVNKFGETRPWTEGKYCNRYCRNKM